MAQCDYCSTTILFGGVRDGDARYCNATCHQKGVLHGLAHVVPDDVVQEQARLIHQGECPRCGGPGPVDVHTSHRVHSFLVMTQWSSRPQVSCGSCGVKS